MNTTKILSAVVITALACSATACTAETGEQVGSTADRYEEAPTVFVRSLGPTGHNLTTGWLPPGAHEEVRYHVASWGGVYDLYACQVAGHIMPSRDPGCEGQRRVGWMGRLAAQGKPLYRCRSAHDHLVTTDPGCEGYLMDGILGYVHEVAPGIDYGPAAREDGDGTGGSGGEGGGSGGVGAGGSL